MKHLLITILAVSLLLVPAFAQVNSGAADNAALNVTRGSVATAEHGENRIYHVVARHCDKYLSVLGAKVWDDLSPLAQQIASDACKADDSAIYVDDTGHNVAVRAGISARSFLLSDAAPASAGAFKYLALTSDTTAPADTQCAYLANGAAITAADCALGTGEYTTVGLGRALATFAYGGANTYTLDKTWTCSSCSSSVVAAVGVYDRAYAAPKGVLGFWYKFGSSVTLNGSDQVQVTVTITVS